MNVDPWTAIRRRTPRLLLVGMLGFVALGLSECGGSDPTITHCHSTPQVEATPDSTDVNYDVADDPHVLQNFEQHVLHEPSGSSASLFGNIACLYHDKIWLTEHGNTVRQQYSDQDQGA